MVLISTRVSHNFVQYAREHVTVRSHDRNTWCELSRIFCFFPKSLSCPKSPTPPGCDNNNQPHPSECLSLQVTPNLSRSTTAHVTSVGLSERTSPGQRGTGTILVEEVLDSRASRKSRWTWFSVTLPRTLAAGGNGPLKNLELKNGYVELGGSTHRSRMRL